MKPDIETLRKKYMDNPPEGMTPKDIRLMSEDALNILVDRNRKSGNLEIGVPILGNRLFCA